MNRRGYLHAVGLGGTLSLTGCGSRRTAGQQPSVNGATLTLATATTVHDSGLLAAVIPGFERDFGAEVAAVVRGTGGALRTARGGDCDVVVVHARPLEDEFIRSGDGINRRAVMVNDFLVVGPPADPAGIAGAGPVRAFDRIARADASFLSRGDRSGTHLRERRIWAQADAEPAGSWYGETGQGMGQTLVIAAETGSYTLTDRGTFLNVADDRLRAQVETGLEDPPPLLRNEYAVIPVNPAKHDVEYGVAMTFVGHLTGPAQRTIDAYRINGDRAFRSIGLTVDPTFEQYVPSDWEREGSS